MAFQRSISIATCRQSPRTLENFFKWKQYTPCKRRRSGINPPVSRHCLMNVFCQSTKPRSFRRTWMINSSRSTWQIWFHRWQRAERAERNGVLKKHRSCLCISIYFYALRLKLVVVAVLLALWFCCLVLACSYCFFVGWVVKFVVYFFDWRLCVLVLIGL